MDLLSQYNKDHPEALREQKPAHMTDAYGREYSKMVALVIRLSGGRIRDARQANRALLIAVVAISFATLYLFVFTLRGGTPAPLPYEQTYKPFQ